MAGRPKAPGMGEQTMDLPADAAVLAQGGVWGLGLLGADGAESEKRLDTRILWAHHGRSGCLDPAEGVGACCPHRSL